MLQYLLINRYSANHYVFRFFRHFRKKNTTKVENLAKSVFWKDISVGYNNSRRTRIYVVKIATKIS